MGEEVSGEKQPQQWITNFTGGAVGQDRGGRMAAQEVKKAGTSLLGSSLHGIVKVKRGW